MAKVSITAQCGPAVLEMDGEADVIYDYHTLKKITQLDVDTNFADYLHDPDLIEKVESGYTRFALAHSEQDGYWLNVVCEYETNAPLTAKEIDKLMDYTQGQWSDGIGEGYEQFPQYIDDEEVYISMWYPNQSCIALQECDEDGN